MIACKCGLDFPCLTTWEDHLDNSPRCAPAGPHDEDDPDDFEVWMRDRFRQGTRHLLSPLAHVVLHPVAGVVVMTAEQALRLSAWLRECAGLKEE